jgi:hypothetical protein
VPHLAIDGLSRSSDSGASAIDEHKEAGEGRYHNRAQRSRQNAERQRATCNLETTYPALASVTSISQGSPATAPNVETISIMSTPLPSPSRLPDQWTIQGHDAKCRSPHRSSGLLGITRVQLKTWRSALLAHISG